MLRRLLAALSRLIWICSASLAAVMASERMYWYWSGIDLGSLSILTGFYASATAMAFWALSRVPGHGAARSVLGGAVFALVIEGVVTPVIYEDGPLPLLYLMFVGWHGLLAFVGFVYLVRRWALLGRPWTIAIAATSTGVWWGVWALSSAVSDRETAEQAARDGGSATVLAPGDFGIYAGWVGVALLIAHLVMDRTWPRPGWRPTRTGRVVTCVAVGLLALVLVLPAVPWAPLKLGALGWAIHRLLRRGARPTGTPTVIDELAGRVRKRNLLAVLLLPISASLVYLALWPARDHPSLNVVFWSMVALQIVAGVVGLGWAVRRTGASRIARLERAVASSATGPGFDS